MIGQAPNQKGSVTLGGATGNHLAQLAGMSLDRLHRETEQLNLLPNWPGYGQTLHPGDAFDVKAAVEAADAVSGKLRGCLLVLLGRHVARAFGYAHADFYQRVEDERGFEVAIFPHPSRVSHHWNRAENVRQARAFLATIFGDEPTLFKEKGQT